MHKIELKGHALLILLLATIAALPFLAALSSGYFFDDNLLIKDNPSIRELKNIPIFFTSKEARVPMDSARLQDDIYRPLQMASYALSYSIWKENITMFHAENILIHVFNATLLYMLLFYIFRRKAVSFFSAAIFAVHPVQREAVIYLSGRADLLCLSFCLLSLLAFVRHIYGPQETARSNYLLSITFFGLALFTKEMASTLPLIMVTFLLFSGKGFTRKGALEAFRKTLPYFAVLIFYLALRTVDLGRVSQTSIAGGALFRLSVMAQAFFGYFKLIVFPARLTFFHDFDLSPDRPAIYIAAFFLMMGIYIYAVALIAKKDRKVSFLLVSYLVSLLPVSGLIALKAFMQERFLYLPSAFILPGIVLSLSMLFDHELLVRRAGLSRRKIFIAASVILTLAIAFTHMKSLDWKDQKTLMVKEASLHPKYGVFYFDLGVSAFRQGDFDEAILFLKKALEKNVSDVHRALTLDMLGNCYNEKGDQDLALEYYERAVSISPDHSYSLNSIGNIYFKREDYNKARVYFERAVGVWPSSEIYNKNLGSAFFFLGDKANAIKYWKRSLELEPGQPDIVSFISEAEVV